MRVENNVVLRCLGHLYPRFHVSRLTVCGADGEYSATWFKREMAAIVLPCHWR